jgi:MscS family membrane protein
MTVATKASRLLLHLFLILLLTACALAQKTHQHHSSTAQRRASDKDATGPSIGESGSDQQTAPAPPTAAPEPIPVDPLGRETPYGCVIGFLQAATNNDLAKAAQYLDTKLPEPQAEQLAQQLKVVLDTGLSSSINGLSHEPQGSVTDDLWVTREKVGVAKTANGNLDILLDRVKRPQAATIWLFSSETLVRIPSAFANLQKHDISSRLPSVLVRVALFGLPLWRWLAIVTAIILALLLSSLVSRLLLVVCRLFLDRGHIPNKAEILHRLKQPLRMLLLALALWVTETYSLSVLARHYWTASAFVLGTIGAAWFLAGLFDLAADAGARHSLATGAKEKVAVINLARRLVKILSVFLVLLILLKGAGVNVSAMLAGLGIGGIALALAAQKTLEDLFGGISIIMRDAIRVGDYCRLADQSGTIEDIGLSATRLRTLDRTVVSIPNSKIAQLSSENIALRDKFWFHHVFSLRYDTRKEQIERILADVQAMMEQTQEIERGTSRINFVGLQDASFEIEVFAYLVVSSYVNFLVLQQELLLQILAIVANSGARLTVPLQSRYANGLIKEHFKKH